MGKSGNVIDTKLILIEGIIGSGKTTTAENLADIIYQNGREAVWYHENAPQHPLNNYFSRILQDNYGKIFNIDLLFSKIRQNDPEVDTLSLWRLLENSCLTDTKIKIIESRFWQHESMYWLLMNFDLKKVMRRQQEITKILSTSKPFLIYLANDEVSSVIKNIFETRPDEWKQWVLWLFGEHPYFTDHNLSGINGLIKFFEVWNEIAEKLFDLYPYSKLLLRNSHNDWSTANRTLYKILEVE